MSNRTHPRSALVGLACLLALAATPAWAGDARAVAMGGAHTAAARGLDAAVWNPAALAFSPGTTLGLAGVSVDLHNNSFSLGRYNEVSGAELSEADKQRLLADIPDGGFRLDTVARVGALGLQVGRLALSTGAVAAGRGNLDRDFFDLVLFGNELGETVDFSDTWGDGHAVGKAALSWGQPVYEGVLGRMAVGVTASYLYGIYEMHVEEAYGSVTTAMTEISGTAYASAVTADQGSGYGLDLGYAWQTPGGWTFGLALDNVLGSVTWSGNVERHEFRVDAADINVFNDDLDNAVADSDTSYAAAAYTTSLPRRARLGAAWDRGTLLVAADWVQGFGDRAGSSTTPQLNLGAEWRPLGFLRPRGGAMLGGAGGVGLAGGLGLDLLWWQIDLAVVHRGGFSSDATRGLGFAVSSQFVF
ncbi:MAG: DUF5723 family protein [Candidatus Krumholzibacteriia bacterium]